LPGLEAELYYVREGVVNTYAMNFVVPVPASIADLDFSWQSLAGHPVRMSANNYTCKTTYRFYFYGNICVYSVKFCRKFQMYQRLLY
ncbi:Tyrosine-protein kinase Drl, partial [Habropoda laboriosa]